MIKYNKNDILENIHILTYTITNIVLGAVFTSIRYIAQENITFRGKIHF